MNPDYKWQGTSAHLRWTEVNKAYFPMFSFTASIYDEEEMFSEFLRNFEEAKLRGLNRIRLDFPAVPPESNTDFVHLFKQFCLPYQKFERSPLLTYSFIPDIESLVDSIRQDEIYTVPDVEALPKNANGLALVVSKNFTELWEIDEFKDTPCTRMIWRASRDWGVKILEEASKDEE